MRKKKYDEANTRINTAISQEPNNVLAYQMRGEVAMAQRKFPEAEQAYRKLIERAPSVPNAYQKLALVFLARQDLPGAMGVLENGIKTNPKDLTLPAVRAEWLTRSNQYDLAIQAYEDLLKRAPADDIVANNLAYLLTEIKGDKASLDRALQLTGKFADSSNPGYLDSLGWVHYKLGQFDKAVPILERAVSKSPESPLMQAHLGMALYKKGDTEKGKVLLKKVLESKANIPNKDEVRKMVGQG